MASLKFLNPETGEYEKIGIPSPEASGVQMKLLWENPNPTSAFAAQTISLDLSKYTCVLISYKAYKTYTAIQRSIGFKGEIVELATTETRKKMTQTNASFSRDAEITETGIIISKGYEHEYTGNLRDNNDIIIPVEIYGIETGSKSTSSGGGVQIELLWENPDPTVAFAEQTLNLDLSNFDMVDVYCIWSTSDTTAYSVARVVIDGMISHVNIQDLNRVHRKVTAVKTGLNFGSGEYVAIGGTTKTSDNKHCIPMKIYGIKGVS